MSRIMTNTKRSFSSLILALVLLLLTCIVAACGSNIGSGSSTGSSGTIVSTPVQVSPTAVKGYGSAQGCPSDLVVSTAPTTANVVIKQSSANSPVAARVGDIVEVRLPFGHRWNGPMIAGSLAMQQPAGYAWKSDNVCIWRFTAKSTGTTTLSFSTQALCKKGQMCPMYIAEIPFTVVVK